MKISAQEEYGLRCLLLLAHLREGESLTLAQIGAHEGISSANAGKLMWLLNKAGFVTSTRGTKGGYCLARPAEKIYLNEIIKVLDDDELSRHCTSYSGLLDECIHNTDCGIRPVIIGLHEIVENALSRITLAQLVGSEVKVDRIFHEIQGIHQTIEPLRN